jgi:hypothetical protein
MLRLLARLVQMTALGRFLSSRAALPSCAVSQINQLQRKVIDDGQGQLAAVT